MFEATKGAATETRAKQGTRETPKLDESNSLLVGLSTAFVLSGSLAAWQGSFVCRSAEVKSL